MKKNTSSSIHKKRIKNVLYWSPVVFIAIVLIINSITLIYPVAWGFMTSFKDIFDYTNTPNALPTTWVLENWETVFTRLKVQLITPDGIAYVDFWQMLETNLIWAFFQPLPGLIAQVLMAYVIALYRNKFTRFLYTFGIALMCLVVVGTFPAQMTIMKQLGVYDNMFLYIITSAQGGFSGFSFLLYYNLFSATPKEYAEAAEIDGANQFTVMRVAYLPSVYITALVYYILGVIGAWNDYGTFLIWLPSYANLAYGMYLFNHEAQLLGATIPEVFAGFFVVAIPSTLIYIFIDKKLVENLKVTGLK